MNTSRTAHAHTNEADAASARVSPHRRRALAAAGLAGLAALVVGGAAAADEAKPGDALYEIDRALEDLGINDGGSEERLEETEELVEDGEVEDALETADEAVEDMEDGEELDEEDMEELTGLLHAAESVLSNGSEQSLERRTQVAEMLTFMATTELKGKEFGQAVSAHARGTWVDELTAEEAAEGDLGEALPEDADELAADDGTDAESAETAEETELTKAEQKAADKAAKAQAKAEAKASKAEAKAAKAAAKAEAKAAKANAKANK